jgi:beta-glucanase (GH16 family)
MFSRMRFRRPRRSTTSLLAGAACAAALSIMSMSPARGADLLRDDFDGASLDQSKWGIGTWLLGRTQLAFTPQVTGGMARLRLDTYNPGNTSLLRGSEILSDLSFTRGSGLEYEARVRTNPVAAGGTVTSFFTYIADAGSPPLADEIDFEWLSKHINASPGTSDPVLATTWNNYRTDGSNFGDPNIHSSVNVDVANLNLATFNTFKIRWLPDRVQWYVNDVPIRTAKFAVPDAPAPIRANFWAPNTDWGDAYSAALQPVNNAGANTTFLYDIDHIAVRRIFSGVSATGPGRVVTDTFRNGNVANTDAVTSFWTQRSQGAGSSITESNAPPDYAAEPLKLRAGGAGFPHAQIASGVRSEFNFFRTPLAIEAHGIGFSSTSNSTTVNTIGKSILRFSLSSSTLSSGAESEYTVADALSLRIEGTNLVALGYKVNAQNANSEYNTNLLGQTVAGPVRSVKLVVHGSFYQLQVGHDVSETDSAQTTSNFSGPLTLNLADWSATGDAAMFVQGQLNNSGANENMTAQLEGLAISTCGQRGRRAAGRQTGPRQGTGIGRSRQTFGMRMRSSATRSRRRSSSMSMRQ